MQNNFPTHAEKATSLPIVVVQADAQRHVSYSVNSLKGGYIGDYAGLIQGDAGS